VTQRYEAIVVGGGVAGGTAAILLAEAGWSVALVEKKTFPRRKVCGECIAAPNLALLDALGVGAEFAEIAGPSLTRVGLYVGEETLSADLPRLDGRGPGWARALGRERLDSLLLERAARLGVAIRQPSTVKEIERSGSRYVCRLALDRNETELLEAPVLIAAHGSWEPQPWSERAKLARAGDLVAFKANFSGARLEPGLLPVLAFRGGYGGMVIAEGGMLTLACCIRRDTLRTWRAAAPTASAGDAVRRPCGELPRRARRAARAARRSFRSGRCGLASRAVERALGLRRRQRGGRGTSDPRRGNQHGDAVVLAAVQAARARARRAARRRSTSGGRARVRARLAATFRGACALGRRARARRDAPGWSPPAAAAPARGAELTDDRGAARGQGAITRCAEARAWVSAGPRAYYGSGDGAAARRQRRMTTPTFETMKRIIVKDYELKPERLTPDTPLADVELDSLAVTELIFALEDSSTSWLRPTARNADARDIAAYIDQLIAERDAPAARTGS
jgi:hypothetical protein